MEQLKVGDVIFQRFRKLSRGRVPQQTCSQSALRGVSTHDMTERTLSEQPPSDSKIETAEKNKRGQRLRNHKARSRTRVNIGSAFQRWRELKEQKQGQHFRMAVAIP